MIKINRVLIAALFLLLTTAVQAASTVHKPADQGPFWHPIGNSDGTYVYADSFVAPESGSPTALGTYLREDLAGPPSIRFEVWGDDNGPDPTNVIASTGSLAPAVDGDLTCFYAAVTTLNGSLTQDETYWFAATVVGEPLAPGEYQTGGHTQNSVYADNGTFWYSNDPAGINFDGQDLTPEIAFEVRVNGGGTASCTELAPPAPEPAPIPTLDKAGLLLLILLAGIGGMVFVRTREV